MLGYLSLAWLAVGDAVSAVRRSGTTCPPTRLATMYDGFHPVSDVARGLFVVGHVLGTILLGIGMLRGRVVRRRGRMGHDRRPADPLRGRRHRPSHPLDLVGWGLNAVGFAALSVAILRLPDDEWAPAPRRL